MSSFRYALPPGSQVTQDPEHGLRILTPESELRLREFTPGLTTALKALQSRSVTEEELSDMVSANGGEGALSALHLVLLELEEALQVHRVVEADGMPLATLVPTSRHFEFEDLQIDPERTYVLSRFAYAHRVSEALILESPRAHCQVVFHDWRGPALMGIMSSAFRPAEVEVPSISSHAVLVTAATLLNAAMLVASDDTQESEQGRYAAWEFHDLLFHSRSRAGRHSSPYGRQLRFPELKGPAVKPSMSAEGVDLHKPEPGELNRTDARFNQVLEGRRSDRIHDDNPLTAKQLGEFLFRAARVRTTVQAKEGELTRRPYPGAGAAYELEIYPVVHNCEGVPPGMYHYCPAMHRLERLVCPDEKVEQLLASAARIINAEKPQVLFVVAARFPRLMWRYSSIGYSLILKNLGGLYQTMYLTASAMGIAACAVGGGDSDLFAEVTGLDYLEEGAVGEFVIGTRRS